MKSFDDSFIEYFSCSKLREQTIKQTNSDCSLVTTASSTDKLSLFICWLVTKQKHVCSNVLPYFDNLKFVKLKNILFVVTIISMLLGQNIFK